MSPLYTKKVPKKLFSIPPSPLHGKGGSGHKVNCPERAREGALGYVSRGSGIKVRQSWTFMGIFMASRCGAGLKMREAHFTDII